MSYNEDHISTKGVTMEPKVIADIVIHEKSDEDRNRVAQSIHEQLCGKQSYIDNAIILNIDEPKTIRITIFDDCENIGEIHIR
jgi:hypothetical protein